MAIIPVERGLENSVSVDFFTVPLRVAISSYLGRSDAFDRALASFAEAYADQNERDYGALRKAATAGENQLALFCTREFLNELGTGGLLSPVVIYREKD